MSTSGNWPILTRYDVNHLQRIALPLGGIGTGTVSLGGRGNLQDWEIRNKPDKGYVPGTCFFAIRAHAAGEAAVARALEGPLPAETYEGQIGSPAPHHGLPRFRECEFLAAYPLGQVLLLDPDMPVQVRMQAFNPMIPGDDERSGLPIACLRFSVTNLRDRPVEVSICGNIENFLNDSAENLWKEADGWRGVLLSAAQWKEFDDQQGTLALSTLASDVTHRLAWPLLSWGDTILDFWDDFLDDGRLGERQTEKSLPIASLCARISVPPRATEEVTFLLAWNFPNRSTWFPPEPSSCCDEGSCGAAPNNSNIVGNYYARNFSDAWDVVTQVAPQLERLEADTVQFIQAFCDSDFPHAVKEAALYNLSTLRSQTCFRTADGRFYGWEGCHDKGGCCHGSCTHVWNYEQATAFLYGNLTRAMREVEFLHATRDDGLMSFRVNLPIEHAAEYGIAAADGQLGCLMKLYRDWQLCGDDEFLQTMWPRAKKALEFCWIEGGWDGDKDGVMEGCQHNTMDVEYFGPNPQMQGWYLGALRACQEMAQHQGDDEFAATCRDLFQRGSKWMDENLFNGEYYEHQIWPISDESKIAPGLRHTMGSSDLAEPILQLGAGCLIDQLVGQYMAHICGLGYLHEESKVKATLQSLMRHNFKQNLWGHFNHFRTFALQEESAMLMASYPLGRRPQRPFPYANEVMTGFEYTAAAHMLYEAMHEEGMRVIEAIRERYDGRKRSPFNEAECGHHYARAMASWAAVLALTGFEYSAVERRMKFAASDRPVQWFWSSGDAWGVLRQRPVDGSLYAELKVLGGEIKIDTLIIGKHEHAIHSVLSSGKSFRTT